MWICIAPCRDHTSKALRYGTRSQGISQFYLYTPRSSACIRNGMNHTCLCLPSRSCTAFYDTRVDRIGGQGVKLLLNIRVNRPKAASGHYA